MPYETEVPHGRREVRVGEPRVRQGRAARGRRPRPGHQGRRVMVLVGPSGSGKTTALRMLAGLEPLDGGRVEIGEKDVTFVPPKDRDIAMVFQNYALYPSKTVAENMGFALKMQGVPKEERSRRV